jgi:hypothetical protein
MPGSMTFRVILWCLLFGGVPCLLQMHDDPNTSWQYLLGLFLFGPPVGFGLSGMIGFPQFWFYDDRDDL